MTAKVINGKKIADDIMHSVRQDIIKNKLTPGLAVFLIGDDEASKLYVSLKEKACQKVSIDFHSYICDDDMCQADVIESLGYLNTDDHINAILVQLPLPDGFNQDQIIEKIKVEKDVDGFHPQTLKNFLEGKSDFIPGLSLGIIRLIESTHKNLSGKSAIIVANSDIFSKPLVKILEEKGVKAITATPDDSDLKKKTSKADILIVAIGRPKFITADMVKEGAIVIDVGTTKYGQRVVGDVDFEKVKEKAGHITPVPGGVGPVTVAMLLENVVKLTKRQGE